MNLKKKQELANFVKLKSVFHAPSINLNPTVINVMKIIHIIFKMASVCTVMKVKIIF